jgi:hypothetical protein
MAIQYSKKIIAGAIISFLFLPEVLFASSLQFEKTTLEVSVNEKVPVRLMFVKDGAAINALEGSLTFDPAYLTPTAVLDGGSIIGTWIKNIDLKDERALRGSLLFSGIIPRGLTVGGEVVTVIFTAHKKGETYVAGTGIAYKNDGKATPTVLTPAQLPVAVKEAGIVMKSDIPTDTTAPVITRLDIAQNEAMFDGGYFIVFAAKDGESGVDHFELFETSTKASSTTLEKASWKVVKSPALLTDQSLQSYVYLKAVDRNGNSSIKELVARADLSPQKVNSWFSYLPTLGILIVSVFGVLFFFYHRRQGIRHDSY